MPAAMENVDVRRLNEIKAVLSALLITACNRDITLRQLAGMYRGEEGENIPFKKFNYATLEDFLHSMPDIVNFRYNREQELCVYHVGNQETAHISSLVSRQKKPQKKSKSSYNCKPRHYYGNYYNNYSRPPPHINRMQMVNSLILEELRKIPNFAGGIKKTDILQKFKGKPSFNSIYDIATLNIKLKELSHYLVVNEDFVYFKDTIISKFNIGSNSVHKSITVNENIGVRSAPSQNAITRFETNPKFNEIHEPAISVPIPQLSQVQGLPPIQTDPNLKSFPVQSNQSQKSILTEVSQIQDPPITNSENELIKERVKIRLKKLIENHPEGIWAAELPNTYKKEYNIDLNYHELGFNNIIEFASAIPQILTIIKPSDTDRYMILSANNSLDNTENKQQKKSLASHYNFDDFVANDSEPVPNKLSSNVCQKFVPEGMMGFDETVDDISVTSLAVEDYVEVNISEIFTPSFFWITLRKNKSKIKKLMDELEVFYKYQDLDACRLPQALVETGLNIACIYANMWHRAIIRKVKPDGYVHVLFYDYGTVKTYNPNDLYYLHKKFSVLPAQAIACGLHNVKAIGSNEWPVLSINMFVNKVWGVPLLATVCKVNEKNNTMMITLTDTSDDNEDLHLNEWMIDNGLAERGKMENAPSSKYHVLRYGVPLDKLCLYDEDILRNREQEYEKCYKNKSKKLGGTKLNVENIPVEQAEVRDIDVGSNYVADNSFDASSVATLVRENIDLTKQTNTIAQAILSNLPINKLEGSNEGFELKDVATNANTIETRIDPVTISCSEDIKKMSSDLNRNLNAIKNNFSEINNNSCNADLFMTQSMYLKPNRDSELGSSAFSLTSHPSSFDCMQSIKHDPNELPDHRASSQSLYSRQSSTQDNNYQNQICGYKATQEYDKLSFTDGTPTFYNVKHNITLSEKSHINIKYPSNFANLIINESKISKTIATNSNVLNEGSSYVKESDEGYCTAKFASTSLTSNVSSNTSLNSKSLYAPTYVLVELSDRCHRKTIHVFHLDNEGWVPVNEFIDCFTNLKLDRMMFKMLQTFNVDVNYKDLTRASNPQLFSQLDESSVKAPRESNGKIKNDFIFVLLPIKTMFHVLGKLDFVDPKILSEATAIMKQHKIEAETMLFEKFNNKILYDALNLVIQYRELRRLHIVI